MRAIAAVAEAVAMMRGLVTLEAMSWPVALREEKEAVAAAAAVQARLLPFPPYGGRGVLALSPLRRSRYAVAGHRWLEVLRRVSLLLPELALAELQLELELALALVLALQRAMAAALRLPRRRHRRAALPQPQGMHATARWRLKLDRCAAKGGGSGSGRRPSLSLQAR